MSVIQCSTLLGSWFFAIPCSSSDDSITVYCELLRAEPLVCYAHFCPFMPFSTLKLRQLQQMRRADKSVQRAHVLSARHTEQQNREITETMIIVKGGFVTVQVSSGVL